jgi:hypothetical protein
VKIQRPRVRGTGDLETLVEAGKLLPDAQFGPVVHELVE